MWEYSISFLSPGYLALLLGIPFLWYYSYRKLESLGFARRLFALSLRSCVFALVVLALAEVQIVRISERLTTIFLLDQSRSIPQEKRAAMIPYVNQAIQQHRQDDDRAGVIVFAERAGIEIPPFDDDVQLGRQLDAMRLIDPNHTDMAAAFKLAMASFPEDSAKRVVLISDGNQNHGDVLEIARSAADSGIGIDVIPIEYQHESEVLVENVTLPPNVRRGQPMDLKVVVNNTSPDKLIPGRLVISEETDGATRVLNNEESQRVTLKPGKNLYTLRLPLDEPNFYKFKAQFVPENPEDDLMVQNNEATAFTHLAGEAKILLIQSRAPEQQNLEHTFFADRLREEGLEVEIKGSDEAFHRLDDLLEYDCVILADVPREQFSDAQIQAMVKNVSDMGAGLVMLGGRNSFGAGGWQNTTLEKAMPVDFSIKAAKIVPKGALALIMHASEMPDGNNMQKKVAVAAVEALNGHDYCGLLHWMGNDRWLWANNQGGMIPVGQNRRMMYGAISRMMPGDMPQFNPAMVKAQQSFAALPDAATKLMIIISDGDPAPPAPQTLTALQKLQVKVTTVAIGSHGLQGSKTMQDIATATGGKYYNVKDPRLLPKIYKTEARKISRALIYENEAGFQPNVVMDTEIVRGLEATELPPITGYVMTTLKDDPTVEVTAIAPLGPKNAMPENRTIIAHRQYDLGKTVAFTTDVGQRWATDWTGWENYSKLFNQMVRYAMRPAGDTGDYLVSTRTEDGKVRLIVQAIKDEEFLNFESIFAKIVKPGPEAESQQVRLDQTGPGTYEATFEAGDQGSYMIAVLPGAGKAPIRTGVSISYSEEFRVRETNLALLRQLAGLQPSGGETGIFMQAETESQSLESLLSTNVFRHTLEKARSSQPAWHWLVFAASCLFFFDVFNRRVAVSFGWVPPLIAKAINMVSGAPKQAASTEYMERLRSKKAEVNTQIDSRRSTARFEAPADQPEQPTAADVVEQINQASSQPTQRQDRKEADLSAKREEESYTDRLLKAKRKVWTDRNPPSSE